LHALDALKRLQVETAARLRFPAMGRQAGRLSLHFGATGLFNANAPLAFKDEVPWACFRSLRQCRPARTVARRKPMEGRAGGYPARLC